ncbi:MAG: hypothetical protein ACTSRW_13005 [Candidatus Helarchaeota archaeon]
MVGEDTVIYDVDNPKKLLFKDLEQVMILTTDQGPWIEDVFWVLVGNSDVLVINGETPAINSLIERLQKLPNFDNIAVIKAMGSVDFDVFVCWERKRND